MEIIWSFEPVDVPKRLLVWWLDWAKVSYSHDLSPSCRTDIFALRSSTHIHSTPIQPALWDNMSWQDRVSWQYHFWITPLNPSFHQIFAATGSPRVHAAIRPWCLVWPFGLLAAWLMLRRGAVAHRDLWVLIVDGICMAFVGMGQFCTFSPNPRSLFTFEHPVGLTCLIDSANRALLDPWPAPHEPRGIISSPCNEWRGYTLQPPDKKPPDSECWREMGVGTFCWQFFVLIRPFRGSCSNFE